MKRLLVGSSLLFLACGPASNDANKDGIVDGVRNPDSVTQVAPSTPVGTVSGQVLTSRLTPLSGATVSVNIGARVDPANKPYVATTDDQGKFMFTGLPAGSRLTVSMTKTGYGTVSTQTTIPVAGGNFPINDANADVGAFALLELNSSLKVRVITQAGRPAKGARAYLEASPLGSQVSFDGTSYGAPAGKTVVDAIADDLGVLTFNEIQSPADMARFVSSYAITVSGFDADADGLIDFAGGQFNFTGISIYTDPTPRMIVLPSANMAAPMEIQASNVDSIIHPGSAPGVNLVRPSEELFFTFNQNLLEASILVSLTDETGLNPVMFTRELRQGNILAIKPSASGWESSKEYNISIRANSASTGEVFTRTGYFFGGEPLMPRPFAVTSVKFRKATPMGPGALQSGDSVFITFNQPIAPRSPGSTPVSLFFDSDINNDGMRTLQGEKGAPTGWLIYPTEYIAEPGADFVCQGSGYTTRYSFTYLGPPMFAISPNTPVFLNFSKLMNTDQGYQTIWGVSITGDETTPLIGP